MQDGSATDCLPPGLSGRHTQIPNGLHALVASPREFQLVSLLLAFRWYPSSPIIPSVRTLATVMGCSERTVRRTAAGLEARGLLRREERRAEDWRQLSNEYVLCGALLALVTGIESTRDRPVGQPWPGRRTPVSGERYQGNQNNRTTHQNRYAQPARTFDELLETRYGRLRR